MQFLNPLGFFGLAAITIPLIIHLWNIKHGKTLKIGSISLLGKSTNKSAKSFRITDWLLFAIRTLLFVLLSILLAQPVLKKTFGKEAQKGWVLFEKSQFPDIWSHHRRSIDSLLNKGYEFHDFDVGFTKLNISDTLLKDTLRNETPLSYTSLLRELNNQLPRAFPVYLFSDHKLNRFGVEITPVSFDLKSKEITPMDTVSNWIINVANKIYESNSNPSFTSYKLIKENNDVDVISVLIYEGKNTADANYLRAALKAISDFSGRTIKVETWNKNSHEPDADLVFWLSDESVNKAFISKLKPGTRLFSYGTGKTNSVASFIAFQDEGEGNSPVIELSKRINAGSYPGEALWTDGFGTPLLTIEQSKQVEHYHFYCKLNPQWTDLVWSENFVKAIMPIVVGIKEKANGVGFESHQRDQRTWNKNLKIPFIEKETTLTKALTSLKPLNQGIWIFTFFIFFIERLLSLSRRRETLNV